ncbi:MAG TPA: hypothetical protein VGK88_00095 [bacterium]|jgi:hypothetical protein
MKRLLAAMGVTVMLVLATAPASTQASPRIDIRVCRDVTIRDLGSQGTEAVPTGCAREFSISLPYVVMFFEIADIDTQGQFQWQLLDPTDTAVATFSQRLDPQGGYTWTYFYYAVLPIAATREEIIAQNPRLGFAAINPTKPAKENPGEWKLRAVFSGLTVTGRFVLKP